MEELLCLKSRNYQLRWKKQDNSAISKKIGKEIGSAVIKTVATISSTAVEYAIESAGESHYKNKNRKLKKGFGKVTNFKAIHQNNKKIKIHKKNKNTITNGAVDEVKNIALTGVRNLFAEEETGEQDNNE